MNAILRRMWSWVKTEPARVHIYAALTPVVGILVERGVVTSSYVPYIEAGLLAVLGIAGVETARSQVVPISKLTPTQPAATPDPSVSSA